jgi:hypothetical protein
LILSNFSFSQVVYYDTQPDLEITTGRFGPSTSLYCSLQELGIDDSIYFSISFAAIPVGLLQVGMSPSDSMYLAGYETNMYEFEATNIEPLTEIVDEINFSNTNGWVYLYCDGIGCSHYEFEDVESGFIGFAYVMNGDTLYGWIRLSTKTPDINNIYSLSVVDMAINQQPEGAIFAGEGIPPVAEYLVAQDVSDYRDERDIEIKFSNAINYAGISEYRVFIVPSDIADLFDMSTAQGVSEGNYFTVEQTDTIFLGNVPAGTKDCQGNEIQELISYKIFVMSIADGLNLTENYLSQPSNDFILTTSVHPVQNAETNGIHNVGNSYTVNINFDAPEITTGILHHRILFVNSENIDSLNVEAFLQVLPENYIVVELDDYNYTNSFNYSVLKDIYDNPLTYDNVYKVVILTVADMIDANVSVIVIPESDLIFATPCNSVTIGNAYDNANNGNASDIKVSFDKVDETQISSYRVFVVKNDLADSFKLETANSIQNDCYFEINPSGTNIEISLPPDLKSSDGDFIIENEIYRIFVQSVADLVNTDINALSPPSYLLVLHNPDYFKAGQSYGDSVSYFDFNPDLVLTSPIYPETENYIDLFINNDAVPDAQIVIRKTPMWHGDRWDVYLKTLDNTAVCVVENQLNSCMVMHEFQMIGPYNTWHSGNIEMAFEYHSWEGEGLGGSWHNLNNGYMALANFSESDTVWAWYNISLYKAYSVTIHNYAKSIYSSVLDVVYDVVKIFPNPANSYITISLPNDLIGSEIELYSIQGKLARSFFAANNEIILSTYDLNSGIYVIKIIGRNQTVSYKLVVE